MSRPSPDRASPADPSIAPGISREGVDARQRERIFTAVAEVVVEEGCTELTVRKVTAAAGVSTKTFYEHFSNRREVALAAHDAIFARLLERIETACAAKLEWPATLRAAIAAVIGFATAEPQSARLLSVDGFAADGCGPVQRAQEHLATMLSTGRRYSPRAAKLPPLTELALVGAIWTVVAGCLDQGNPERLSEIEGELIELALAPYVS